MVKKFGVLSVGKVLGALYALLGLIFGAIAALFSLLGVAIGAANGQQGAVLGGLFFGVGSVIVLPIVYGILGFIGGVLSAALYNLVARFVGGIEIEIDQRAGSPQELRDTQ